MKIQTGTGFSSTDDTISAATEAAENALRGLAGARPDLVIVFTSPRYDLPLLIQTIRSITGQALLVGSTSSGEIVNGTHLGIGAGVAVLAMTAGEYRFGVSAKDHIRDNLDLAGQQITREARQLAGASPHAAVILLADSMAGDLQQLFQGAYRITGPRVSIVGGAAGDDQKFHRPLVFHNDRIIEEGALALWVASSHPLTVTTRHGWKPIGLPLLVTRARGTQLIELSGRPAAEAYEQQIGLDPGQLSEKNFWNTSITHPLGMLQSDGTSIIRVARSKTVDGALNIQGCLPPEGSAVQVMAGNVDTLLDITEEVIDVSLKSLAEPGLILAFSCAAREMIFGSRQAEEATRLQNAAGAVPTFGLYCCGEFARTAGVLGTHNASLTVLAL